MDNCDGVFSRKKQTISRWNGNSSSGFDHYSKTIKQEVIIYTHGYGNLIARRNSPSLKRESREIMRLPVKYRKLIMVLFQTTKRAHKLILI